MKPWITFEAIKEQGRPHGRGSHAIDPRGKYAPQQSLFPMPSGSIHPSGPALEHGNISQALLDIGAALGILAFGLLFFAVVLGPFFLLWWFG